MSRTKFLQHTRPSELARHTLDDISCIHNPYHNVMHLTKSQQTCLRKSFPTSVSPPASLSHSPLWCGFYFMALDNPNVSLQVPLRGVGWLAHARKHTHTRVHTHVTLCIHGACSGKTSRNKLRQETEYIILSTTSRETNDRQFKNKEEKKKKAFSLQLFYKRKHAC